MLTFQNPQDLEIYSAFFNKYSDLLNELTLASTVDILCINTNDSRAQFVTVSDDPFATNTIISPIPIVMNEDVCNALCLTQEECFAMIAHEIGHIIDKTPRKENDNQREINADSFANKLGLAVELISSLSKIIDSGNYSSLVAGIQERIRIMKNEV